MRALRRPIVQRDLPTRADPADEWVYGEVADRKAGKPAVAHIYVQGHLYQDAVCGQVPDRHIFCRFALLQLIGQRYRDAAAEIGDGLIAGFDSQGEYQLIGMRLDIFPGHVSYLDLNAAGGLLADASSASVSNIS